LFCEGQEGRCQATWKRDFKLPWRKVGPPNDHDDKVDSDQLAVNKELSLVCEGVTLQASRFSSAGVLDGYNESRRCSRDTHPESCITKILVHED